MDALNGVIEAWESRPAAGVLSASFALAGVALSVTSDDGPLLAELSSTLGPQADPDGLPKASLSAEVLSKGGPSELGRLRLTAEATHAFGPKELLLGLSSPESPFRLLESGDPTWTFIAFRDEGEPLFAFRGEDCLFRKVPNWRTAVALLLFHRLLRLRADAIFLHAASVFVNGAGLLLVGPKGSGKSTVALALAARGHGFLGDETACVLPDSGELLPLRRPVGIKPGPRAEAVGRALERLGRDPDREGLLRIDVGSLLPVGPPAPAPLRAIVFLEGFLPRPRLVRIEAGREELALLQPVVSSLVNAPAGRRVLELARLLSGARCYRLSPGDPDETAELLERAINGEWA